MLRLRPTFEEIEREARTSRLRILPERQRRTQQGILLDEVDFDEFDLSKYDRKIMLMMTITPIRERKRMHSMKQKAKV